MKKFIFVFILVKIASLSLAQNNYFVDDVKYINYVNIYFCIDSLGRVHNVEVNRDFTDYQNDEVIQQIVNQMQRLTIDDVRLFNNCHEEFFTFINQSLQFSRVRENDFNNLEKFTKGKFVYLAPKYSKTKIRRRKHKQIERTENGISKYEINWIAPNLFTLTHLKVANKDFKYLIDETIEVEIISIIDEHTYIYRSILNGIEIYGMIKKK